MKIAVIGFLRNSVSEFEENCILVFVSLMLFLMDLKVLLTRCLMGYKEPGKKFSRIVMGVIQL